MARKPTAKTKEPAKTKAGSRGKKRAGHAAANDPVSDEAKIVAAALTLAGHQAWPDVGMKAVAQAADVSLADVIAIFPDKNAIVRSFMEQIDQAVVAGLDADLSEESPHDRLLDTLIARFEA